MTSQMAWFDPLIRAHTPCLGDPDPDWPDVDLTIAPVNRRVIGNPPRWPQRFISPLITGQTIHFLWR